MMSGVVARKLFGSTALLALCGSAAAQVPLATPNFGSSGNFGGNGIYREDSASALGRYLRMVTANPRDLEALTGAGRAALAVGDAQAAIGFFARAEAISPRNGRIKAGLGSALVLLNQEQAALRYFNDATELGVPEADVASDRGLAYDLRGSAKRAQRDYGLALKRGDDPETTRRMALSLAIGGEKDAALALLDPLLRRQDTAAWRARAFILAMSGDAAGASRAAEAVMSPALAAGFVPFFRKLPSLRPGEKAAAVHFGNFPGEGRPMRIDDLFNQAEVAARVALENSPRSATDAGLVDGSQSAFGRAPGLVDAEGQVAAVATRRSPDVRIAANTTPRMGTIAVPVARPRSLPTPTPTPAPAPASIVGRFSLPAPAPAPAVGSVAVPAPAAKSPAVATPLATTAPAPGVSATASPGFGAVPQMSPPQGAGTTTNRLTEVATTVREVAREPLVRPAELPPSTLPSAESLPDRSSGISAIGGTAPSPVSSAPVPSPAPAPATTPASVERLADIGRVLSTPGIASNSSTTPPASLPRMETASVVPPRVPAPNAGPRVEAALPPPASGPKFEPVRVRAEVAALIALSKTAASPVTPAPSNDEPDRMWVQIAGGADEGAFASEWRKLKAKAPDLLADRTAWTTPLKATNRLLVGPFDNQKDAQGFVNKLGTKGITAFAWASAKGQAIAKLSR